MDTIDAMVSRRQRGPAPRRNANDSSPPRWDARSIKALRDYLGYTQQQLAEELGTRQQTISEWERGQYRPRGATVTLLNIVAERTGFVYEEDTGYGGNSGELSRA